MNKELLLQIFKSPYNRQSFIDNLLLPLTQGKVDGLEIYDQNVVQEIALTASEEQYAKSAVKYGEFTTKDEIGRTVELYEVILHDHKLVERNRVGIAALIKKQIIGNNAVLVNFAYESPKNRAWRFSFIAYDAVFSDGELIHSETNPKRYTYVLGEPDETYRTAYERFYTLGHEYAITIDSLKEAFGVEAISKAFFDEYRDIHYNGFVDYLTRSNFKAAVFNGDEKAIRDFVKRLLGRIVFLYFIQKKGWLGASNGSYKDGDKNFMSNFFKKSGANESFYSNWLSKLFFETLNEPRPKDAFEMPDGSNVMIPYLNGGLFEKESNKYDFLCFPTDLFTGLFEFFDQYNFTIYEDSPEEHTVAVDPEMLGHIFENLLEDNKDKGAFYTPKEIVHYMTQESLIEYLHTQIPNAHRDELESFVKNKDNILTDSHKKQIDQKLDAVKICDPAIGSGAFPMGCLQEIFSMKERIAFELGNNDWDPATVKEHIIQNSIYGVDIEKGAVDIARLRFWLSLIVDEETPKPLPNLDYKIVVGNSLVSKFEGEIIEVDWSQDTYKEGLFDQVIIAEKTKLLKTISEKQKAFFVADNDLKPKLSAEIRKLKLDILAKQLELLIEITLASQPKITGKKPSKKVNEANLQIKIWKQILSKIKKLRITDRPFNHFNWKLDFPEVLNPIATKNTGFDIVIGNPPYIKEYTNRNAFEGFRNTPYYQGKMDLWYGFACIGLDLIKEKGIETFIAQNNWVTSAGASKFRNKVLTESEILLFTDFWNYKVFKTAGIQTMIYLLSKKTPKINYSLKYSVLKDDDLSSMELVNFLDFNRKSSKSKKYKIQFCPESHFNDITFNDPNTNAILDRINAVGDFYLKNNEVANGIHPHFDFVNKKMLNVLGDGYTVGDGIFGLSDKELKGMNLNNEEKSLVKNYYPNTKHFNIYHTNKREDYWLIYTHSKYKDPSSLDNMPTLKLHLDKFQNVITSDNKPYGLHRARDEKFFSSDKIVAQRKCPGRPVFTYVPFPSYFSATFYLIKTDRINMKYLTMLLNSKLVQFWLRYKGKMQGNNYQIDKAPLVNIPIVQNRNSKTINLIFDYLMPVVLSKSSDFQDVNNQTIFNDLEEIANSLIFELYFPEDFKSKGIEIEKHAKDMFTSTKGLNEEQELKQIKAVYEELHEKKNPLRNQIKLMKIELKELLNPILSV